MTLSTYLYVHGKIDLAKLHEKAQSLVTPGRPLASVSFTVEPADHAYWPGSIVNSPGQGFDAWLMVHGPGGPENGGEEDEDGWTDKTPVYDAKVNWDTAYGYTSSEGCGCAVLHAKYIVDLGTWLLERGLDFSWKNEFTGEVHSRFDGLEQFIEGGDAARAWFNDVARPAIMAHAKKSL